jgi:DNA-binding GntR family transcriptional regulator
MLANNTPSSDSQVPKKPAALADWTYEIIKQQILDLEIRPGDQLHIEDFIDRLGVSRTPIREAFQRLASEGLIEIRPRVGYFVSKITQQDIRDLFEIREIIEARAARKAADKLTSEEIRLLAEINQSAKDAVATGDYKAFMEKEILLHNFLQKHIENKRLATFMETLNDLTYRERMLSIKSEDNEKAAENVRAAVEEHQRIIAALLDRDGEKAAWFMAEHLKNVSDRLVVLLNENGFIDS